MGATIPTQSGGLGFVASPVGLEAIPPEFPEIPADRDLPGRSQQLTSKKTAPREGSPETLPPQALSPFLASRCCSSGILETPAGKVNVAIAVILHISQYKSIAQLLNVTADFAASQPHRVHEALRRNLFGRHNSDGGRRRREHPSGLKPTARLDQSRSTAQPETNQLAPAERHGRRQTETDAQQVHEPVDRQLAIGDAAERRWASRGNGHGPDRRRSKRVGKTAGLPAAGARDADLEPPVVALGAGGRSGRLTARGRETAKSRLSGRRSSRRFVSNASGINRLYRYATSARLPPSYDRASEVR